MADGFYGLLDFTGVPVGVPTIAPRGGMTVAGRQRMLRSLMVQEIQRSLLDEMERSQLQAVHQMFARRLAEKQAQWAQEIAERQAILTAASYTTLLAEV